MKRYYSILILFFALFFGCQPAPTPPEQKSSATVPERLVAMTPSVAEILFSLGLGEKIVGVCRFCRFPPEVENIPKIGGLLDRDNEAVLRLKPDLVIEMEENSQSCEILRSFGIEVLTVDHKTVDGVMDSILTIGQKFGPETLEKAEKLRADLLAQLAEIEKKSKREKPVRVLICVDRERGTGQLLSLYIAGKNPFYNSTLEIAGGVNVAGGATQPVPIVSVEEVLRMNPEVIIDLCTIPSPSDETQGIADWNVLGNAVDAVRNKQIYVFTEDYTSIPGPRLILYVEQLAEILAKNDNRDQ